MAMFDERAAGAWFAATPKFTVPLPCPLPELSSEIQDAETVVDHVQSRSVVTVTVPVPPDGPKDAGVPARDTRQRGGVAPVSEVAVDDPQAAAANAAIASTTSSETRRRRSEFVEVPDTPHKRASRTPVERAAPWLVPMRASERPHLPGRGAFDIA